MAGKATERQQAALEAVWILRDRLGRAPSASEVAKQMGCALTTARQLMVALAQKGLMTRPELEVTGEWGLTPAGKREVKR